MGRKIPGKKHRGVRDPLEQIALRNKRIAGKINAPPADPDDQGIPKSLARVMELTRKVKDGIISSVKRKKKKSKKKNVLISTAPVHKEVKRPGRPEKSIPVFEQAPGESGSKFLYRVNQVVQSVLKEAEFEDKYQVEVQRNFQTGEVEGVKKRKKDEIDELMKRANDPRKKKKKKKVDGEVKEKLSKGERRKQKLKARKQNKLQNRIDDFGDYKDLVKFGDVVHNPPDLKSFPRTAQKPASVSRPGSKTLLLSSLLESKKLKNPKIIFPSDNSTSESSIDLRGKRKDLPETTRIRLEKQRVDAVNAYKLIKAKRSRME